MRATSCCPTYCTSFDAEFGSEPQECATVLREIVQVSVVYLKRYIQPFAEVMKGTTDVVNCDTVVRYQAGVTHAGEDVKDYVWNDGKTRSLRK